MFWELLRQPLNGGVPQTVSDATSTRKGNRTALALVEDSSFDRVLGSKICTTMSIAIHTKVPTCILKIVKKIVNFAMQRSLSTTLLQKRFSEAVEKNFPRRAQATTSEVPSR